MFPHTVTICTILTAETPKNDFCAETVYCTTVLRGVLLDTAAETHLRQLGAEGADSVTLYIPFSVSAVNPNTGAEKQYVAPGVFFAAEDRSGLWTLSTDGRTFFLKGETEDAAKDFGQTRARDDGVYLVTKVGEMDFGEPDMRHFEVGGK